MNLFLFLLLINAEPSVTYFSVTSQEDVREYQFEDGHIERACNGLLVQKKNLKDFECRPYRCYSNKQGQTCYPTQEEFSN